MIFYTGDYAVLSDGTFQRLDASAFHTNEGTPESLCTMVSVMWMRYRPTYAMQVVDIIEMPDVHGRLEGLDIRPEWVSR